MRAPRQCALTCRMSSANLLAKPQGSSPTEAPESCARLRAAAAAFSPGLTRLTEGRNHHETPRVHHAARRRISTSKLQAGCYSLCGFADNPMGKCCHGHDPKITRVPTEWSHSLEVHLRGRRCLAATCVGGCPQRR